MKNYKGFSAIGIIITIAVVALLGAIIYAVATTNTSKKAVNFDEYDIFSIIGPSEDNGNIGDHIKGNPDAPVVVFEYADYQCSHCASMNQYVNKAVKELGDDLAVVFRNFLFSSNKNSRAAAAAVEAAGLQGYWSEYLDKIFSEQVEWATAPASDRTALFEGYFKEVTDGKGDINKFAQDMASDAVAQKISFDIGISKKVDIDGTPAFFVDGQFIDRTKAGSVVINGETISWDESIGGDKFVEILKEIVKIKTKTAE